MPERDLDVSSFPSFAAMELEAEPLAYSSPGKRVVQRRVSVTVMTTFGS